MKYHFKYTKERTTYWAKCVELDGCFTQGKTLDELKENMREALNLHLDEPANSKIAFAPPRKSVKGRNIVAVSVDPRIAFALNLRHLRAARGLTQKETAKRLGFKNLFSYQRLESSKTGITIPEVEAVFRSGLALPLGIQVSPFADEQRLGLVGPTLSGRLLQVAFVMREGHV